MDTKTIKPDLNDCNIPKLLETLTGFSGWQSTWEPHQTSFSRCYAFECSLRPDASFRSVPDDHYYALVELDGYLLSVYADSCSDDGVTFIYDSRHPDGWKLDLDLTDINDDKYQEFLKPAIERAQKQLLQEDEDISRSNP